MERTTMTEPKSHSHGDRGNSIDEFLNSDQEDELSRPESVPGVGFDNKADDVAHRTNRSSQEHSLDDVHETQTPTCLEKDLLGEAVEDAKKKEGE
jgi:hypothetical protein